MPKCGDMCRCCCRTLFGLMTFAITCLGLILLYNPTLLMGGIAGQFTSALSKSLGNVTSLLSSQLNSTANSLSA
jgi:hypothetical protein